MTVAAVVTVESLSGRDEKGTAVTDPLTWAALGGVTATEGIKFLYEQAGELLKAWRERRRQVDAGDASAGQLSVPILANEVLDAQPTAATVDVTVLDGQAKTLIRLFGALSPYAQDQADIELADGEIGEMAARLRTLLEAVYGQRLTFRGEQRDSTGTRVTVRQVLEEVGGPVIGARSDIGTSVDVDIDQNIKVLKPGGSVTGFQGSVGF